MVKQAGGVLVPASDIESDRLKRFKTNETYEIEIKLSRNADFHRKVFAFFNFCFEHWKGENEYQDESKQFDVFRSHMTVLAGYYDTFYSIHGHARVEAKSISYAKMTQEEFESLYSALINVALKNIFLTTDQQTYNRLLDFF